MKIFYGRLVDTCRRGIWGPIHNHPCTSSILKYLYWPFIQLAYCNVDLIIIIVAVYQLQLYSTHFCLCVCLCVCVHDNSKNNGSIDLKLRHWALSDQGQGHGVTKFFSICHNTNCQGLYLSFGTC